MKRYKRVILAVSIIIFVLSAISVLTVRWYNNNYWAIQYQLALYDHIQYNGVKYYMAYGQDRIGDRSDKEIIVYIVDDKGVVNYNHPYNADGYIGDDEHRYLFFDSAIYTRIDDLTPAQLKEHKKLGRDLSIDTDVSKD